MTCFFFFPFGIRCKARASGNEPRLRRMWENSGGICTHDSSQHGGGDQSWMCFKWSPPGEHIPPRNSHLSSHQQFGLQRQPSHLPLLRLWLWAGRWHADVFSNVCANMEKVLSITVIWPRWRGRRHQRSSIRTHIITDRLEQTQCLFEKWVSITSCSTSCLYATAKFYTSKVLRHLGDFRMTGFSSKVVKACTKTGGWKPHHGLHCRNRRRMENTNRWMETTSWSLMPL